MPAPTALARLRDRRSEFRAFLAARLGNAAEADDVLQNGLLKAVQRAGEVRDHEKLTAWFYQVLRHAIVDHVCAYFEALLPELKPREAELRRRVELQSEAVADAARVLRPHRQ